MGIPFLPEERSAEAIAEAVKRSKKIPFPEDFHPIYSDCIHAEGKAPGGEQKVAAEEDSDVELEFDDWLGEWVPDNQLTFNRSEQDSPNDNKYCTFCWICLKEATHFDPYECPERCQTDMCFKKAHSDDDHLFVELQEGECADCENSKHGYCYQHRY